MFVFRNRQFGRVIFSTALLIIFIFMFLGTLICRPYLFGAAIRDTVPNRVHYVHMLADPNDDFQLEFKHFMSVYSAWYHWRPETIYLHTDASESSIQRARFDLHNKWNRLVLSFPALKVIRVPTPTIAQKANRTIEGLEHRSDFVRVRAVYDFGGVYIDFDVYAVRNIDVLRESGFSNIFGRQAFGEINSGAWMASKQSNFLLLWSRLQHEQYDGGWTTHSNGVLTTHAPCMVKYPGEMLIMEQWAFAPHDWTTEGLKALFEPHLDQPSALTMILEKTQSTVPNGTDMDIVDDLLYPEMQEAWMADYSSAYMIHAFSPERQGHHLVPGFDGITPSYILSRQSNLARAIWPAAKHAYDNGFIDLED